MLNIEPHFCPDTWNPMDTVEWTKRNALIKGEGGKVIFEQQDVDAPEDWSDTAVNIVVSHYFYGDPETPQREKSIGQLIHRVCRTIADWGVEDGYFDQQSGANFYGELAWLCLHQRASFNSPVWFNVGLNQQYGVQGGEHNWRWVGKEFEQPDAYEFPQSAACQPYYAKVVTEEGLIPIGELVTQSRVGLRVFDGDELTPILAVKSNGQKPVYKIHLRGGFELEATADHVVCATKNRQKKTALQWRRVDELQPGMFMWVYPHVTKKVFSSTKSSQKQISEAALAGWLQTDGYVGQAESATSLTMEFESINQEEFDWIIYHLDQVFPNVHRQIISVKTQDPKIEFKRIRLYGQCLRFFVDQYDLIVRNPNMQVPVCIMSASEDIIIAYLRSVFQADGWVLKNGRQIGVSKVSEKMIRDIHLLLISLGIYSRLRYSPDKRKGRLPSWKIAIAIQSEQKQFANKIGFISDYKQSRLYKGLNDTKGKVCPDIRFAAVESIEFVGTQDVYDIQTESGKYLSEFVLVHNCFIQRVDDNMQSIMRLAADEAMLFKYGSGTGSSLSRLRATHEKISGGGKPSGPLSFMRIYDSVAGVVKSGGVTRRAALMHTLDDYHPDVLAFIQSKQNEELKAKMLLGQGLTYQNVYETMAFQNVNISVRLTDTFMQAVAADEDWETRWVTDPTHAGPSYKARELFNHLCKATWDCGDPGVQFDTTINAWHTCAGSGRIRSSNPCSEFMFLDNSACNLASINLTKFHDSVTGFNAKDFQRVSRLLFIAQEILVGRSSYPTRRIAKRSYQYRPIGLGYTNLGSLIMLTGLAYDSNEARTLCSNITALMCGTAYLTSTELAGVMGPFEKYEENSKSMMTVIAKHWSAAQTLAEDPQFGDMIQTLWLQVLRQGEKNGFRNAQATVLAPTGTISFMMDCSTTGIEPLTSLITYKKLASEGVLELVDKNLIAVLAGLGYGMDAITSICDYVTEQKEIAGAPALKIEHLPIFDCSLQANPDSRCISWEGHVRMMAAAQQFISGAISKTVNIPATTTPEDVGEIYKLGHRLGLKAIAVYRDRSKGIQPLSVKPQKEITVKPYRKRLSDTRESITHKFSVAGHDGFVTVGLYPDGDPGELFITMAKEGSTVGGLMDCLGLSVSMGLQYGVPLESFIDKFSHVRFEPQGMTKNPDIRFAKSLVDYIFRWLEQTFDMVPAEPLGEGLEDVDVVVDAKMQEGAPLCEHCGSITVRSGTCYVCKICGHSLGCS